MTPLRWTLRGFIAGGGFGALFAAAIRGMPGAMMPLAAVAGYTAVCFLEAWRARPRPLPPPRWPPLPRPPE